MREVLSRLWLVFLVPNVEREQQGGFAKGRFWRMCPRKFPSSYRAISAGPTLRP